MTKFTSQYYGHFRFLPTLASVRLRLTPNTDGSDEIPKTAEQEDTWRKDSGKHMIKLFTWLAGKRRNKVQRILKLVVEDNMMFPCSEAAVQTCLGMLKEIRYLDWKRPNISVDSLKKAEKVTELWLYSTGINAVLSSWSDKHGLQRLESVGSPSSARLAGGRYAELTCPSCES